MSFIFFLLGRFYQWSLNLEENGMYTSPTDKLKAFERVVIESVPTRIIVEELSVSLTSVQQWVKQYNDFGPEYFTTQVRSSDGPDAIQAELERFKKLKSLRGTVN